MKKTIQMFWIAPLALLIAGCAPVQRDTTISEWQREGLLPPTGVETTSRVYPHPADYPASQPGIIVGSDNQRNASADLTLANNIRRRIQYDRGLAPSLQYVTIDVQNGRVILEGMVKSELDARVIVDGLRDVPGVTDISDQLQIDPDV